MTILTLYREKLSVVTEEIPDFAGYIGRLNVTLSYFEHITNNLDAILEKKKMFSTTNEDNNIFVAAFLCVGMGGAGSNVFW